MLRDSWKERRLFQCDFPRRSPGNREGKDNRGPQNNESSDGFRDCLEVSAPLSLNRPALDQRFRITRPRASFKEKATHHPHGCRSAWLETQCKITGLENLVSTCAAWTRRRKWATLGLRRILAPGVPDSGEGIAAADEDDAARLLRRQGIGWLDKKGSGL
jgi:hypothetical protein